MSRRHELDSRLEALGDIGKIMRSMKNLSFLETRKLGRYLESQSRVVEGIDRTARDFLSHYPDLLSAPPGGIPVYVVIGSERGFCGSFNEALISALGREIASTPTEPTVLIAVGSRLSTAIADEAHLDETLPGPSAAEEVPAVLNRLIQTLDRLNTRLAAGSLFVLHWDAETESTVSVPVLPPFRPDHPPPKSAYPFPPRLNLPPQAFLELLIEHYLFAALHRILFSSLMAEHQQRVRHLEGALQRVDDITQQMAIRRNALRQEEITEEIELILLNLPSPAPGSSRTA